jgi:hypothetical protein
MSLQGGEVPPGTCQHAPAEAENQYAGEGKAARHAQFS